jgi:hypothetical protein
MHGIITFSVGLIVCLFGLMFLGYGVAKFRQVFTAKPTPGSGLFASKYVYLCAEVAPQNPSLHSPLGKAKCVYWGVKVWAANANARGSSSSILHQESEGHEFLVRCESGAIRVRFGLRYLPPVSAESVELTQDFVTYSDQQHMGKAFSCPASEQYIRRHGIAAKQMGVIPKSLMLEEKSICPGQVLHIWGRMNGCAEEMSTLEATMISAKGALSHWLRGATAVLAGIVVSYVGLGLMRAGIQGS